MVNNRSQRRSQKIFWRGGWNWQVTFGSTLSLEPGIKFYEKNLGGGLLEIEIFFLTATQVPFLVPFLKLKAVDLLNRQQSIIHTFFALRLRREK